jgi:ribosome-binding factor A
LLSGCSNPGELDGLDPRYDTRGPSGPVPNRKALQLCRQVAETLAGLLAGECHDDLLRDLLVQAVVPAPHAGRMLVTVYPLTLGETVPVEQFYQRLEMAGPLLRSAVASAIHRRRTPELTFRVVKPGG